MPAQLRPTPSSDKKRAAARLPRSLEKNLLAYTAAAGGALVALGQPAAAEIVYTPSNIPMAQGFAGGAITQFDINNDGIADFAFSNFSYVSHGLGAVYLKISPDQTGNAVVGVQISGQQHITAAALAAGVQVGPGANFQSSPQGLYMGRSFFGSTNIVHSGSWLTVETAYLGLKFVINGEVHYGWARVKLVAPGKFSSASIYGYAYETVANQAIVTGQTSGAAKKGKEATAALPAAPIATLDGRAQSLGVLALGAAGTAVWRSQPTANR